MIEMKDFLPGLLRLAVASRQPVEDAAFEVYREALGLDVTADEWEDFTLNCVRYDRFPTWFPKVSEIRDALREWRGEPRLELEAMNAYERVLEAGSYSPEGGTRWSYRGVREKCGLAAAEAFLAAGSHSAFSTTWNEAQRRKAFAQEYVLAARGNPAGRLLPAGEEQKQLEAGK